MRRVAWRMVTRYPMRAFATFLALCYGAAVIATAGVLLESALRYHGVWQQYAASPVVVATTQLTVVEGSGEDLSVSGYPLREGGRIPASLAARIAAVPGVRSVVGDVAVPVQLLARSPAGAVSAWSGSGHSWPAVLTPGQYQAAVSMSVAQNTWTIHVIVLVLLLYVVIAALNTLAMAAFARRTELAVLRLAGVTRGQVLRMAEIEQAVLLGLALAVGGLIAAATLVPMVNGATGSPAPYIPAAGWVGVIGGTVLLGVTGTLLPVVGMLRTRPVEAVGVRE